MCKMVAIYTANDCVQVWDLFVFLYRTYRLGGYDSASVLLLGQRESCLRHQMVRYINFAINSLILQDELHINI